jgi:hypothetical protein
VQQCCLLAGAPHGAAAVTGSCVTHKGMRRAAKSSNAGVTHC